MEAGQAEAPFDYLDLTWGDRGRYVPDMGTVRPPLLDSAGELRAELGVPLLLCAAFRRPADIAEALESGADEYMMKPFDTEILRTKLRSV